MARPTIDMTGSRVGCLTVIERVESDRREARWRCACDCGNEVLVYGGNLRRGTRSCGCLRARRIGKVWRGTTGSRWTGDRASYSAVHMRVAQERGSASAHECVDCSGQAFDWSWSGDCNEVRVQVGGRGNGMSYCLHAECYAPRCRPCHRSYDTK